MRKQNNNEGTGNEMETSPLYEEIHRGETKRSNARFFATLLFVILIFLCLRGAFVSSFARIDVDGTSMYPTLKNDDSLFMQYSDTSGASGFFCYTKTPARGDVVIVDVRKYHRDRFDTQEKFESIVAIPFETGGAEVNFLIKRLVGMPGDTVKEENGRIYYLSAEDKAQGDTVFTPLEAQPENVKYDLQGGTYELGEGEILILGDNTNNSTDGRFMQTYKGSPRSHLKHAYKIGDICGVVPRWAVKWRSFSTGYYDFADRLSAFFG